MKTAKSSKRQPEFSYKSEEIESLKTLPSQIAGEAKYQGKQMGKDFFSQLAGYANDYEGPANDYENSGAPEKAAQAIAGKKHETKSPKIEGIAGELIAGIEYQLVSFLNTQESNKDKVNSRESGTEKAAKAESRAEPGISYHSEYFQSITRSGENLSRNETSEHNRKIKQVIDEIKKLAATTKELQMEFGHITVSSSPAPETAGKYYVNFFEWLLIMLKQARQKVENSKSWLDALQGKSSKKMGYWGRAKKFGTSFTQNNERNVATSTG